MVDTAFYPTYNAMGNHMKNRSKWIPISLVIAGGALVWLYIGLNKIIGVIALIIGIILLIWTIYFPNYPKTKRDNKEYI